MMNKFYLTVTFIVVLVSTVLSSNKVVAQSATAYLAIGGTGYEVEIELDNSVYKVKLTKGDENFTEKTNYLTINSFRDIVFKIHSKILVETGSPGITPDIRNSSEPSISSAFLQLITELYNTEALGQKIAEVTLRPKVVINDLGTDYLNKGLESSEIQRYRPKWNAKQDNKKIKRLVRRIRIFEKRGFKTGLDSGRLEILNSMKEELKMLEFQRDSTTKTQKKDSLKIESARLVFEDGAIRQITIQGKHNGTHKIFSNKFSIGASTRKNIQNFSNITLYQETHAKPSEQNIKLSEAINYQRIVDLKTNDFSPADVTVELVPDKKQDLYKSSSAKLFSLNIFSDLVGFNNDNPNGLVQFEFSKRINLWTKRTDAWLMNYMGIGWFTYMTPKFELAKIEENNRNIELSSISPNDSTTINYLNPLDLHRFSYARISTEVNFIDLQGPSVSLHSNFFVGVAVTQVQDTVAVNGNERIFDESINSLMLGANMRAIFNPESRWSFELSSRWTYFDPLNSNFTYQSIEKGEIKKANNLLSSWEFLFTWNTGEANTAQANKLFGRFRFNHEWNYWNNNYSEFQIGYSIFLKSNKLKTK